MDWVKAFGANVVVVYNRLLGREDGDPEDDEPMPDADEESQWNGELQSDGELQKDDVDLTDDVPIAEVPAGNFTDRTDVATTMGGDRREVHSGRSGSGFFSNNPWNVQRPSAQTPKQRSPRQRATPPPVTTQPRGGQLQQNDALPLPPHYYVDADQALRAHQNHMKRRVEERHDRGFTKRRKLAPFANSRDRWHAAGTPAFPESPKTTIEYDEYDFMRDHNEYMRHGRTVVRPGQKAPKGNGATGDDLGSSRIEQQRKARDELLQLSQNAQKNREPSQSPKRPPLGVDNRRDRATSRPPGQWSTSPKTSRKSPSQQQGQPTAGERPPSSQTPPKPASPKQTISPEQTSSPKQTSPPETTSLKKTPPKSNASSSTAPEKPGKKTSPSRAERERRKLDIDGLPGLFGVNNTQKPGDKPSRPRTRSRTSRDSPPRTGPPGLPAVPRPIGQRPLRVDAMPDARAAIEYCESRNWGTQDTSIERLFCSLHAILQSIRAQHPDHHPGMTVEALRDFVMENAVDEDGTFLLNLDKEQLRGENNFNLEEISIAVAALGYRLVIIVQDYRGPIARDMGESDQFVQTGGILVMHLQSSGATAGHFQSVGPYRGPKDGGPIRVGKEIRPRETGDASLQLAVQNSLETAKAEAAARARESKKSSREDSPTNSTNNPSEPRITSARLDRFRRGLADCIHNDLWARGRTVNEAMAAVNTVWHNRPDRGRGNFGRVDEFSLDETRAALEAISAEGILIEFPVRTKKGKDCARRLDHLDEDCKGQDCPCGSDFRRNTPPRKSRKESNTQGESSSQQGQRGTSRERRSPGPSPSTSPHACTQPEVQVSVGRLSAYRKALTEIMDHAEHRGGYFNPGVKDGLVLLRLNRHLREQSFGDHGVVTPFEEDESKACLSALSTPGDLIEYPVNGNLVRRLRPAEFSKPRGKDNTVRTDDIGGALAGTFGPKPTNTELADPRNKSRRPSQSGRQPRNSGNGEQPQTRKKRKSNEEPAAAPVSPSKKRKSPPPSRPPQQALSPPTGTGTGYTKSGKKRPPMGGLAKKFNDRMTGKK